MSDVRFYSCANGHDHEVQPWAPKVPNRCMFAPCSQPFLSPQQLAARTRKANKERGDTR